MKTDWGQPEGPLDLNFVKSRYDWELERKEKLTASLTLPVGILTALGGLMAVMARSFSYTTPSWTGAFLFLMSLTVAAFVVCLVFLAMGWHHQDYEYLPLVGTLDLARAEFEAYYDGEPALAVEEFVAKLRRAVIDAADTNTTCNDRRSKYLYKARRSLLALLMLTATVSVPYVVDQARSRMSSNVKTTSQQSQGKPTANPQRPAPQFPPNRIIREGQDPIEKRPLNIPARRS